MATHPRPTCEACGKPATSKCSGCRSDSYSHAYCSQECQKKDRANHKRFCQNAVLEKSLTRGATILHEAYLKFRENTWDTPIIKVEESSEAVIVHKTDLSLKTKYFVDFPKHLFKTEEAKIAAICMMACHEPLGWMHDLLCALTHGRSRVDTAQDRHVNYDGFRHPNFPNFTHFLLRITVKTTKSQWALDIGGGQYGIHTPLWKWKNYAQRFLKGGSGMKVYGKGTIKAFFKVLATLKGERSMVFGVVGDVVKAMHEAVVVKGFDGSVNLPGLHSQTQAEYDAQKAILLGALDGAARAYIIREQADIKKKHKVSEAYEARYIDGGRNGCKRATDSFFINNPGMLENPLPGCRVVDDNGVTHYFV